jgi:hypothetical protein
MSQLSGLAVGGLWVRISSSNVEAARRVGPDLEVRFRAKAKSPASTYRYAGAGHLLADLVAAPSAGQWVWRVLRPAYRGIKL